jgi:hypothetical protein
MKIRARIKIITTEDFFHTGDIIWNCFNFGHWTNFKVSQFETYTYHSEYMSVRFHQFVRKLTL